MEMENGKWLMVNNQERDRFVRDKCEANVSTSASQTGFLLYKCPGIFVIQMDDKIFQ